jgi:hypothetical protein
MQIPILSGIYTDNGPDIRQSYPVNLVPVPADNGVSAGYLRPADGLVTLVANADGVCRGSFAWQGVAYFVTGTSLVSMDQANNITVIGSLADGGPVAWAQGFDRLGIASGGTLYYLALDGVTLTTVADVNVGNVVDAIWVDGYWMVTDGEFIAVSDLTDPTVFNPLKYNGSESDPDPILALQRLRNEVYAINRNSIECFDNVGGTGFPFDRIDGAKITKGAIGTNAVCIYLEALAFVGSGYNEAPGVYLGQNAQASKISTVEIDRLLATYSEADLATLVLETRNDNGHQHLYMHLPDRCMVFDAAASAALESQVWFCLTSSVVGFNVYRARHFVWVYDRWLCGDPTNYTLGYLSQTISSHWESPVRWEFGTAIVYGESRGAMFHALELVSLTGRVAVGATPLISTSWSADGQVWSQDRSISAGTTGDRAKRLVWLQQGYMRTMRMQRFRGDSSAHLSFARLEATIEGMAH